MSQNQEIKIQETVTIALTKYENLLKCEQAINEKKPIFIPNYIPYPYTDKNNEFHYSCSDPKAILVLASENDVIKMLIDKLKDTVIEIGKWQRDYNELQNELYNFKKK